MSKKIIVLGGGPAGYVAAIRGAQLGAQVTLIESGRIGGTCLNEGCIPTKALYQSASLYASIKEAARFGIETEGVGLNLEGIEKHKIQAVEALVSGVEGLLAANGVEVIYGEGYVASPISELHEVRVTYASGEVQAMQADAIFIATGSEAVLPPIPGMMLEGVVTSDALLKMDHIPMRLTVLGGGVIGMELASIYKTFGSEVTIVEFADQILPMADSEIVKRYMPLLKKQGIDVFKQTRALAFEKRASGLICLCEGKKGPFEIESDEILVAVGRKPRIGALNLDEAEIQYTLKGITVDEHFVTNRPNIYAIGDVNGKIMLAHAASHQAIHAVEHFLGVLEPRAHAVPVPSCIFIHPEMAMVGATEDELKAKGEPYVKSKFQFGANGKALTMGEGDGLIKVLSTEGGVLLGVHILGPHASDLIHEATLAISSGLSVQSVKDMIHAHPTLSEAFHEAILGLKGEAIHMAPLKK